MTSCLWPYCTAIPGQTAKPFPHSGPVRHLSIRFSQTPTEDACDDQHDAANTHGGHRVVEKRHADDDPNGADTGPGGIGGADRQPFEGLLQHNTLMTLHTTAPRLGAGR